MQKELSLCGECKEAFAKLTYGGCLGDSNPRAIRGVMGGFKDWSTTER